jgi:SpoVK/Ycf46/Vps4 family AAA+-type ATPase
MGSRGETLNAVQRAISLAGQTRCILGEGYLFLNFPNERVVVSAETRVGPGWAIVTVGVRSDTDSAGFFRRWRTYARAHNHLRNQAFFADGQVIERRKAYSWEDILLPEETKRIIRTHVEAFLRNRLRLKALGVKARRGLIFSGPPGTGKTLLGKVLADTLEASFLWVCPRHVQNAASFQEIMSVARFVAPAVVFLEDLDLFAEERDHSGWAGLGELMNQLDGAVDNEDIVTIATTNRLDVIEKALRNRPGRFDRVIEFSAMDEPCRRQMLGKLLAHATLTPADLNHLVAATADYTGAQLEELANTLYILALDAPTAYNSSTPVVPTPNDAARLDRCLIETALAEMKFDRKGRLGFHAA